MLSAQIFHADFPHDSPVSDFPDFPCCGSRQSPKRKRIFPQIFRRILHCFSHKIFHADFPQVSACRFSALRIDFSRFSTDFSMRIFHQDFPLAWRPLAWRIFRSDFPIFPQKKHSGFSRVPGCCRHASSVRISSILSSFRLSLLSMM